MHEHHHDDHHHQHGETHRNPAPEPRRPPSRDATVVLDIGDGVGALVVHAPSSLLGVEIELARRGDPSSFVHTEVRERRLPDGTVYAGVYPHIDEGDYTLLDVDGGAKCDLTVRSGRVTEVSW